MKDAEYERLKRRIDKYMTKWQGPMGLRWFKITTFYERAERQKHPTTGATTTMDRWQYHDFDIVWYLPQLTDLSDENLEEIVVHELCHVLLAPISFVAEGEHSDDAANIMEMVTTMTQKALMWVREEDVPVKKPVKKKVKKNAKS